MTSDRVNKLEPDAEVFYRRLLSKVDDHGLYDARLSVLRAALYPLRIEITTENTCLQLLTSCVAAKLVELYAVDGKHYLHVLDTRWKVRSEPKFPRPAEGTPVFNCEQLKTPVLLDVVVNVVEVVNTPRKPRVARPVSVLSPSFLEFWTAYPRKEAKPKALRAFTKLNPDSVLLASMLVALERQKRSDQWQRGVIPHPASWLNGRRWEDEAPLVEARRVAI